ncbi:CRISPR-associated protein [Calditerricola satsumensis]|uniref:CRISPR-associated protein Csh2 n=1 Tax=Calditerricola satsumensis TaxID=373054 RepID=A0A8J3BAW0_9BACI|nr:type I CRISPR-associated protein Cas7 [Calditerricola satsumensis]GGK07233.1 CRISPR-associated protein Csh2 [Calditerricola satsumensis]
MVRSGELLFVKSVKDGIPNRDPLADSDARRLFDEEDGRISLSDVSIKRDVRDFVLAKYPDGGPERRHFVFVREERVNGKLLNRRDLAKAIVERAFGSSEVTLERIMQASFDARVFGIVFSVKDESFHRTGPVQFGWAHSLHPVESRYVQGTVVMPAEEGKGQGTIWTTYLVPFAVFLMPGVINATLAKETGMDEQDLALLFEGLWKGTLHRQARGRGLQQPLFLLHVEYEDPFYRIGHLEEAVRLLPDAEAWRSGRKPSSLEEIELDVTGLAEVLEREAGRIARVRYMAHPALRLRGELPGRVESLW